MKNLICFVLSFGLVWLVIGLMGCRGPSGHDGSSITGPQGEPGQSIVGPPGADGTQIVPVKFCPETASYPSTFPEYGLCINGQIYAVYSANDGFLALIPDGQYMSNAIGSQCDFIVNGCSIEH